MSVYSFKKRPWHRKVTIKSYNQRKKKPTELNYKIEVHF